MASYVAIGFVLAAISAFFNGSFPVWSKIVKEDVDSVVFNGLVGMGACLSSLIVPLAWGEAYVFSVPAMLGGFLFLGATLCTFQAIAKIGLGTACATWACTSIFVSFLWGAFGPQQVRADIKNLPLSLLSLTCLAIGAVVIISAESVAQRFWPREAAAPLMLSELAPAARPASDLEVATDATAMAASGRGRVLGLIFSLLTGIFGGSVLVPMKFVPKEVTGIQTVVSFGVGAGIMALATTLTYWRLIAKKPGFPVVEARTLVAGLLSGTTWNAFNVCQIVVQSDPINLAYGIAYPLGQCSMLFGGFWGIFVFKEIKGKAVLVFWIGACPLLVGVILLGLYGPGA